jgi:hypothetical protein
VSTPRATNWTVRLAASLLLATLFCATARAQESPPQAPPPALAARMADDQWPYRTGGPLAVDGGLLMSRAMTLGTGMSTGVAAGASYGRRLAVGLRASWATATESSLVWAVTHTDYRLRLLGAAQQPVGRGVVGLRLGLGTTIVHEDRVRNQGQRAMLTGSALETTTTAALPAGDLEAVVSVHVAGPWLLVVSGGPSALISDGSWLTGWTAELGVGWQP